MVAGPDEGPSACALRVEYELIARNPASGRKRRLPTTEPDRAYLDRADHIKALLEGAGRVGEDALLRKGQRRLAVAVMVYAGLRRSELLELRRRDVDLSRGEVYIREGKTAAAKRTVYVLGALRDEIDSYRARQGEVEPHALIFATQTGKAITADTLRRRILAKAVEHAHEQLKKEGVEPLPNVTPHGLRRSYASLLFALGEPVPFVMAQLGHKDPTMTLRFYAKVMLRRDGENERLKELVEGVFGQPLDSKSEIRAPEPVTATSKPQ
jgi:integrase